MEPVASQPRSTSWATVLESVWEEQGTQSPPTSPELAWKRIPAPLGALTPVPTTIKRNLCGTDPPAAITLFP